MQTIGDQERYDSLIKDVSALKSRPDAATRARIAEKVSNYFAREVFDDKEMDIASDIIRLLARDVEVRVRQTLSQNLKSSGLLPHDIALRLASDVQEVAVPMLEFSNVLTDDDLIAIIKSAKSIAKIIAITRRQRVSAKVSAELINTQNEKVVTNLFTNKGSDIDQTSLELVLRYFDSNSNVIGALVNRGDLSLSIVEKILNTISEQIRNEIVTKYKIDFKHSEKMINASRERVTLGLVDEIDGVALEDEIEPIGIVESENTTQPSAKLPAAKSDVQQPATQTVKKIEEAEITEYSRRKIAQTENLVSHLYKEGRLTESLILRSLCEGNILFLEISKARRAQIPLVNVKSIINEAEPGALRSLWRKAKMPDSAFDTTYIIIEYVIAHHNTSGYNSMYSRQLLEYIQEKDLDKSTPLMPYMMALIAGGVQIQDIV